MTAYTVRFVGRFVFFEHMQQQNGKAVPTGKITAAAVDMQANPNGGANRHGFRLTAARRDVLVPGTRPPDGALISSDSDMQFSEHVYWDLSGHDVVLEVAKQTAGVTWKTEAAGTPSVQLPDLGVLGGSPVTAPHVVPGERAVDGAVRLTCGELSLAQTEKESSVFVPLATGEPPATEEQLLADVVNLAVSADVLVFRVKGTGGSPDSVIVISGADPTEAIVTFSNLCAASPSTVPDPEFAGLYEVLDDPPLLPFRLIPADPPTPPDKPKEKKTLGKKFSCYKSARVGVIG